MDGTSANIHTDGATGTSATTDAHKNGIIMSNTVINSIAGNSTATSAITRPEAATARPEPTRPAAPMPQAEHTAPQAAIPATQAARPAPIALPRHRAAAITAAALATAIAFDRLVVAPLTGSPTAPRFSGDATILTVAFWLIALLAFRLAFHAQAAARPAIQRAVSAITAAGLVMTGAWLVLFTLSPDYADHFPNTSYATLASLAMPALMMLHAQVTVGRFDPFRPGRVVASWLTGWCMQPFARLDHIPALLKALGQPPSGTGASATDASATGTTADAGDQPLRNLRRREERRRVALAIAAAVPVVLFMGALLASADQVFAYAIEETFGHVEIGPLTGHLIGIAALTALNCSFLLCAQERCDTANRRDVDSVAIAHDETASGMSARDTTARDASSHNKTASNATATSRADRGHANPIRGEESPDAIPTPTRRPLDPLVVEVVLGALLVLYAAFCAVQFTFLFAGAGLPAGYTYSYYARHGFFQLLAVALIDFAAFGAALTYAPRRRALDMMLAGLLAATGVMLASAALRLMMYVFAYGLTWLRLASLAFDGLLAAMLVAALAKLVAERTGAAGSARPGRTDAARPGRTGAAGKGGMATGATRPRIPLVAVCFVLFLIWFVALGFANPGLIIDSWNASHGLCAELWTTCV